MLAPEEGETAQEDDDGTRAKLWILAEKTGLLGRKPVDVNSFLNYQIERTYKKIEWALKNKVRDIEILRGTIEKLEEKIDEVEDPDEIAEIEKKIDRMNQTIEIRQKKIAEGKSPMDWHPNGAQEAILSNFQNFCCKCLTYYLIM